MRQNRRSLTFRFRTDEDYISRSRLGIILYTLVWPIVGWSTNLHEQNFQAFIIFTMLFIGISLLRWLHAHYAFRFVDNYRPQWRIVMFCLGAAHAITWSAVLVLAYTHESFLESQFLISVTISGLAAGTASSLMPKRRFTQLYIMILILPCICVCIYQEQYRYLVTIYCSYLVYLYLMIAQYHREYERAFENETQLMFKQKELQSLSTTDALTQINNRYYFETFFDVQFKQAQQLKCEMSLILIDIDLFKRVNDTYGHLVGDGCLVHVASVIKKVLQRKSDLVARYGGEEFVILLPATKLKVAKSIAENIRKQIATTPYISEEQQIEMTISAGVVCRVPGDDEDKEQLFKLCDDALYAAKDAGRNCVKVAK